MVPMRPLVALLALAAARVSAHDALDTQHIRLELTVDDVARRIAGRAVETIRLRAPSETLELDAVGLEVRSVRTEDGRDLAFETAPRTLRIRLDPEPPPGGVVTLTIEYAATPRRGVYFVGPGQTRPKLPRQVWTSSWPEDARYWFPCHDDLSDKTTSELVVTVPKDWQVMANGALVETRALGRGRVFSWKTEKPHSTYLLSFVAGEYEEVKDPGPGVPLSYFVYRGRADDARRTFARTPEMLRFFEDETGFPYPFPKYSQAVAADFVFGASGGMENASAVTLGDGVLLDPAARVDTSSDGIIAHELAHQWWGDTVTPAAWSDLWLSEGFATYYADLWRGHAEGEDAAAYARLAHTDAWFGLDPEDRRRPLVFGGDDPSALLDANVYSKGALVLGMLRHMIGDDAFKRGAGAYLGRSAFGTASTVDLQRAMEEASGLSLDWFFDQWARKPGAPDLTVEWQWDEEGHRVVLSVRQDPAAIFRLPVDVRLVATDGAGRTERIFLDHGEQRFSLPSGAAPASVLFDCGAYILKKLRFDKPPGALAYDLATGPTAADRALAARALGASGGDEALAALAGALSSDRFWGVRAEAVLALGRNFGNAARGALRAGAADVDPRVREATMKALANVPAPEATPELLATLRTDPSERVQAEALRSLGALRAAGAYEALVSALARESHADRIRIGALEGLGRLGDGRAVPIALEQSAEGRPPAVRAAAIGALADLGRGQAVVLGRLRGLLDDRQPPIRRAAAEALGRIGDASSLAALRATGATEEVPAVRRAIEKAVRRLAGSAP